MQPLLYLLHHRLQTIYAAEAVSHADDLRDLTAVQRDLTVWEYAFWKSRSAASSKIGPGGRIWRESTPGSRTTSGQINPEQARVTRLEGENIGETAIRGIVAGVGASSPPTRCRRWSRRSRCRCREDTGGYD